MNEFTNVKHNFGFGCMRLPMDGKKVDYKEFTKMVDYYMSEGFNYFDTAMVYLEGQSETAIRDCIECGHCVSRCPFSVDQQSRMRKIAEFFK